MFAVFPSVVLKLAVMIVLGQVNGRVWDSGEIVPCSPSGWALAGQLYLFV